MENILLNFNQVNAGLSRIKLEKEWNLKALLQVLAAISCLRISDITAQRNL